MKLILSILVVFKLFSLNINAQSDKDHSALLLIDIQEFYFDENKLPLVNRFEAAQKASEILEYFRQHSALIIHIRHKGGGEIHQYVQPQGSELIIEKEEVNAFLHTQLLEELKKHEITTLVLAGMQTHMCLEAATRAASDLGFDCTVIHDACATRNLEFEGRTVDALDVQASTLNTLKAYAKIVSAKEFLTR